MPYQDYNQIQSVKGLIIIIEMVIKTLIFTFLLCILAQAVIFRFQPPNPQETSKGTIFNEKPNLVRRRFRNEAPLQSSPIDFCLNYDTHNKVCTKCYDGFVLQSAKCVMDPAFDPKKQWNQVQYMKVSSPSKTNQDASMIILNRNPFCSSLTPDGALCLSCHKGFKLEDGNCVQNQDDFTLAEQLYLRPMQVPRHTFCKTFNENGECIACFPESTYNGSQCVITPRHRLDCRLHQMCLPQSTECLTYSSEGVCKSCPKEAININGICRINRPQSLCNEISEDGKCRKCSNFAALYDGVCKYKTLHCAEYNPDSTCNICLPTYRRVNGECIRPSKIMFVNSDPNCATWKAGTCVQCKFGYGFYKGYCMDLKQMKAAGQDPEEVPILM